MTKKRTLNEYRQTKEHYISPVKQIMAQQIDEDLEAAKQMAEIDHQEDLDKAGAEGSKKFWPITTHEFRPQEIKHQEYEPEDIEVVKEVIVDKITRHFGDVVFEMVCEEMGKNYLFQSQTYLTEEGYEMFEDEWFEFYHEHHGDIMHEVMKNITN